MSLISLLEISKHFEAQKILCQANLSISNGERISIVGKNGSGKSTLLKIVAGALEADEGKRIIQNNVKVKMLPQQPVFLEHSTVRDEIEKSLVEINAAKKRYEEVSLLLQDEHDSKSLLEESAMLSTFLDMHGGWDTEAKVEDILRTFSLKELEGSYASTLSGGEQKRVALASLLLEKPDILLLDEPTNHLDVYMVEFLEEFLARERFTLLFISHDRYFIDNIATKTVEIEECRLKSYNGGYAAYLEQKEQELNAMQKEHENMLRLLKQETEWLSRGVKARVKRNMGRVERVKKLKEEVKKSPGAIKRLKMQLERENKGEAYKPKNRKKMLFEIENLSFKIEDRVLFEGFSTRILQSDRIALVGKNGSGKSTFLKILLDRTGGFDGSIKRGEVKIGYFDQHKEMLDPSKNLIETFCPYGGDRVEARGKNMHVFGYLKNFLFPKEDLDKKIGILSGGEKSRVALALLFTKDYDCLVLDEPTNDLDIPTINILEEYLREFQGAIIFASHDRFFVDKIAEKLFIFGNEAIEESYLEYSEYLDIEKDIRSALSEVSKEESVKKERTKTAPAKLSYKEKTDLERLPQELAKLEEKIAEIKESLSNPIDLDIVALANALEKSESEYEEKLTRYIELEEKRESLGE